MPPRGPRLPQKGSGPLGEVICEHRLRHELTQDLYGARYGVSGPAIFKFEKGFVNPSLPLWRKMAADAGLGEGEAILRWAKVKLPPEKQEMLVLGKRRGGGVDLSEITDRDALRRAALRDKAMPQGLKSFVRDNALWAGYKPTGRELNLLKEFFGRLGPGTKAKYREALRLLRGFTGSEE